MILVNLEQILSLINIRHLEEIFKGPCIVIWGRLDTSFTPFLYKLIVNNRYHKNLNLVILSNGGAVVGAHRIGTLLHEICEGWTAIVPAQGLSASTLLSLASQKIVITPFSDLGPVDTKQMSADLSGANAIASISSLDIMFFSEMAEKWFGIDKSKDAADALAIVSQKVFPPTLTSLYRSQLLVKTIALRFIKWHLPTKSNKTHIEIVNQLTDGFHNHNYTLQFTELLELGLNIEKSDPTQSNFLWDICLSMGLFGNVKNKVLEDCVAGIYASDFLAAQVWSNENVSIDKNQSSLLWKIY